MEPIRVACVLNCLVFALALEVPQKSSLMSVSKRGFAFDAPELDPPLIPKSDGDFRTDYVHDMRPHADVGKWTGVYPELQSTSQFENDYIKDENNDGKHGGHMQGQLNYDTSKTKLAKKTEEVKKAETVVQAATSEAEVAVATSEQAKAKAEQAQAAVAEAKVEAATAEQELAAASQDQKAKQAEAAAAHGEHPKAKEVATAEHRVQEAETKLKGCEQNLADARKALEEMTASVAARQVADIKVKDELAAAASSVEAQKSDAAQAKAQSLAEAEAKAKAASAESKAAEDKAVKEQRDLKIAAKALERERDVLARRESDYVDAENELRHLRGEVPLPKNASLQALAEAPPKKSGGRRSALSLATVLSAIALIRCA